MTSTISRLMTLAALSAGLTAGAAAQCSLISGSNAYTDSGSSSGGPGFTAYTPAHSAPSSGGAYPGGTYNPASCSLISGNTWDPNAGAYNPTVPATYSYSGYGTADHMGYTVHEDHTGGFFNLPAGYDYYRDGVGTVYQVEHHTWMDPNTYFMLAPLSH